MLRLGILVSGGGTNLQAILDALDQGVITNAAVSVVISNNSGAYALKRAEDRGIPAVCISPKCYDNREEFHKALLAELQKKTDRSCGSCRLSGCGSSNDRGGISKPYH